MVAKVSQEFIYRLRKLLPEAVCYQVKTEENLFWLEYAFALKIPVFGLSVEQVKMNLQSLGKWNQDKLEVSILNTKLPLKITFKNSWEEEYVYFHLPFELAIYEDTSSEETERLCQKVLGEFSALRENLDKILKKSQKVNS